MVRYVVLSADLGRGGGGGGGVIAPYTSLTHSPVFPVPHVRIECRRVHHCIYKVWGIGRSVIITYCKASVISHSDSDLIVTPIGGRTCSISVTSLSIHIRGPISINFHQ